MPTKKKGAPPVRRMVQLPPRFIPDDKGTGADARLLSRDEVLERVLVSYPTIWAWMRAGRFPRSREVGGRVCWLASEVNAWIAGLPEARLKGDPDHPASAA
jgi:predicted DNA-binding transcriptional regulator AlpA